MTWTNYEGGYEDDLLRFLAYFGDTKTARGRRNMSSIGRMRGKRAELAIAKYWGMKRNHFERSDLTGHPIVEIECKSRQKRIASVYKYMGQCVAACPEDKVPMVQLHILGDAHDDDLCFMRAKDLRDIIGRGIHVKTVE